VILRPTLPRSRCGRRSFTLSRRLIALAHRVIEHVEDGLAQRLGAVDADTEAATLQDSAKWIRLIISATRYSPDYPAKALARAV
jgi:hypothetical protein